MPLEAIILTLPVVAVNAAVVVMSPPCAVAKMLSLAVIAPSRLIPNPAVKSTSVPAFTVALMSMSPEASRSTLPIVEAKA